MVARLTPYLVVCLLICCAAGWARAAPTGVTLSINQGDERTSSDVVWLYLTATTSGGPMQMRFSNWGFGVSSDWEPYFQKKLWMLEPAGTLNATKGVTVEVKDAAGTTTASDSIFVTAALNLTAVAERRWYYSNMSQNGVTVADLPLGICFDGLHLWVARYDAALVDKWRAPDATYVATYDTGNSPYDVVYDGIHVWIVNYGGGTVTERTCADGALVRTVTVGVQCQRGLFDGTYVWVSCDDGKLYRINAASGAVDSSGTFGSIPRGMAFDGNYLWVTFFGENKVRKIRPSDFAVVATYDVGTNPEAVLFDGANIWVANYGSNNVTKLRAIDGALRGTYPVGVGPTDLAFDGGTIWVANFGATGNGTTVSKLRAADGTPWGTVTVPLGPCRLAFDGASIWVACTNANAVVKL
jgi:hypothetical protein